MAIFPFDGGIDFRKKVPVIICIFALHLQSDPKKNRNDTAVMRSDFIQGCCWLPGQSMGAANGAPLGPLASCSWSRWLRGQTCSGASGWVGENFFGEVAPQSATQLVRRSLSNANTRHSRLHLRISPRNREISAPATSLGTELVDMSQLSERTFLPVSAAASGTRGARGTSCDPMTRSSRARQ